MNTICDKIVGFDQMSFFPQYLDNLLLQKEQFMLTSHPQFISDKTFETESMQ